MGGLSFHTCKYGCARENKDLFSSEGFSQSIDFFNSCDRISGILLMHCESRTAINASRLLPKTRPLILVST